jgi:hypothetical protein
MKSLFKKRQIKMSLYYGFTQYPVEYYYPIAPRQDCTHGGSYGSKPGAYRSYLNNQVINGLSNNSQCYSSSSERYAQNMCPIFKYPGGDIIDPPSPGPNVIYKWVNKLGGGELPGNIPVHYPRPDKKPGGAHGGVLTIDSNGKQIIEMHHH